MSDHITTVAMSMSDQLGQHYTIELNCSVMSARLADTSVTRERALETYEPSCIPEESSNFFISVVHNPLEAI
jgi:hypothetical protein